MILYAEYTFFPNISIILISILSNLSLIILRVTFSFVGLGYIEKNSFRLSSSISVDPPIQHPSSTTYTLTTFGILKAFTNYSKEMDQQELIYLSSRSGSYICKKNDKEIYLKNFFYELPEF